MARPTQWLAGARPRTLPAAVAPVLVGTGAAVGLGARHPERAVLALLVSLLLQVGVNYANDYSDGVRGVDGADRVGPFRLTGSGAASPAAVRRAAWAALGAAGVTGTVLVSLAGAWWLLAVGAAAVAAAWFYTGGGHPYGYQGLGEVFVFVFFGLVAVLGTTYTQASRVDGAAVAAAVAVGFLACAILVANNLRDLASDALAGKRTLAVRLGDGRTRALYTGLVVVPVLVPLVLVPGRPTAALAVLAGLLAVRPMRAVRAGARGLALLPVLRDTGRLELAFGVLLGVGLAISL